MKLNIPFWEETYKNDDVFTFGESPNNTIVEFEKTFKKSGYILDVGCGEGKNSLYLAKKDFLNIDAFDISENAINKLKRLADKRVLNINSWVDNLCEFKFTKTYDLIMSFGTLHFVEKDNWKKFILNAKNNTSISGVHIIQLFTNKLPATPDIAPFAVGMADEAEIKELYQDWEIVQFKSYIFDDEHPGVPKHQHASNKIVARRTK
jgi:cyclopropane fatty-acyl-phospholipid synthase-like methyltransferase